MTADRRETLSEAEWDGMGRADLLAYAKACESMACDRDELLAQIPECPDHGPCLPYALTWLRKARSIVLPLTDDETPRMTDAQRSGLFDAIYRAARRQ